MSLISKYESDHSADLAKRFAALTASYLNDPVAAQSNMAKIPLENLYRILEMYRYDAFEDETRGGVLALKGFDAPTTYRLPTTNSWQTSIVSALDQALQSAFDLATTSKETAIGELQEGLRQLSKKGAVSGPLITPFKSFFATFESLVA
jgi:hypothetical protein